jgi:hypothetical protein
MFRTRNKECKVLGVSKNANNRRKHVLRREKIYNNGIALLFNTDLNNLYYTPSIFKSDFLYSEIWKLEQTHSARTCYYEERRSVV